MNPQNNCEKALEELQARGNDLAADDIALQRGAVLSYLAQLRLSEREFRSELERLRTRASLAGRPWLEAAAGAILLDWEARAASRA